MADPYRPAPWQQGDILRADELNAMQAGLSPIGTIIPWALPFANAKGEYGNVDDLAPFHLPCTGGVYPTSRAPALSAAINGIYAGPLVAMTAHNPSHLNGVGEHSNGQPLCTYDIGNVSGDRPEGVDGFPTGFPDHTWIYCHNNDPGGIGHEVNVYAKSGSTWIHQVPSVEGQYVKGMHYPKLPNGQANLDSTGQPMIDSAIYKLTGQVWVKVPNIDDDGFIVPDMRGRAPFGMASGPGFANGFDGSDNLARALPLGDRGGDHRLMNHTHNLQGAIVQAGAGQGSIQSGVGVDGGSYSGYVAHAPHRGVDSMDPYTAVNFLIACGVRHGSATPSARSGEVHRLHAVTTDHMIRQRLADPNLSDEEREMLEAQLAGEPWPPPVDEPPATRTTTTTRKTAKRKKS